jgi:NAD-dependent dihydropyrimidine dehydrogenase PreA subunit
VNRDKAKILFCNCSHMNAVPDDTRARVLGALDAADVDLTAVDDLCRLAAVRDESLADFAAGELVVIACRPRAVRWLFAAAGVTLDESRVRFFNMHEDSPEEITAAVSGASPRACGAASAPPPPVGEWPPWFPVIDYDRCINCKQCLSFCLFGTYELDDAGRVTVANPAACKTNCPACARICPRAAIIFPKHPEPPINGAPIADEAAVQANVRLNVSEILGDNVFAALTARQKRRRKLVDRARLSARPAPDPPGES